jgi:hypothetical protein
MSCEKISCESRVARSSAETHVVVVPKSEVKVFSSAGILQYSNSNVESQMEDGTFPCDEEETSDSPPESGVSDRELFDEEHVGFSPPLTANRKSASENNMTPGVVARKGGLSRSNLLTLFVLVFLGMGLCNWFFYARTVNDIKVALGDALKQEDSVDTKSIETSAPQGTSFLQWEGFSRAITRDHAYGDDHAHTRDDDVDEVLAWRRSNKARVAERSTEQVTVLPEEAEGSEVGSRSLSGAALLRNAGETVIKRNVEGEQAMKLLGFSDASAEQLMSDKTWPLTASKLQEIVPQLQALEQQFTSQRQPGEHDQVSPDDNIKELLRAQQEVVVNSLAAREGSYFTNWFSDKKWKQDREENTRKRIFRRQSMDNDLGELVEDFIDESPFSQKELEVRLKESSKALVDVKNTIAKIARDSLKTQNLLADYSTESEKPSQVTPYLSLLQTIEVDPQGGPAWFDEHGDVLGNYKNAEIFAKRQNLSEKLNRLAMLHARIATMEGWKVEEERTMAGPYLRRVADHTHAAGISWAVGAVADAVLPGAGQAAAAACMVCAAGE